MPFDGLVLRAVCQELQEKLIGGRIDKIYQPTPYEVTLALRNQGVNFRLLISVHAQMARVQIGDVRRENPFVPPMFCQLMRKHLEGARIIAVEQPGLERLVSFSLESRDELGNPVILKLIAELMGKHSNLVLAKPDDVIIDSIKHINSLKSRVREVMPGLHYAAPPLQGKINPENATFLDLWRDSEPTMPLAKLLGQRLDGVGPLIAREIAWRAGFTADGPIGDLEDPARQIIVDACRQLSSWCQHGQVVLYRGEYSEISAIPLTHLNMAPQGSVQWFPANLATHVYFEHRETAQQLEQLRQRLAAIIGSALTKAHRKEKALVDDWESTQRADEFRLWGELLKTHPQPGEKRQDVEVVNYYDPEMRPLSIPLDNKLSVAQNAQHYFKRYNKARTGQRLVEEQLVKIREEIAYLESVHLAVTQATDKETLQQVTAELTDQAYMEAPRPAAGKKNVPLTTAAKLRQLNMEGYTILVGRNNQQNDELTMRTAASDDVWLHVKDIPGSHVVIRSSNPPEHVLKYAAQIAAYFSQARQGSNVPVDYTLKRHVRKPRGARPGFVIYDHQRTLFVHPASPEDLSTPAQGDER